MIKSLYVDHTPIETHRLQDRTIYVKRDDLYAAAPAPPLGKLRGVRALLAQLAHTSVSMVGCFQTRISNVGHGVAAACLDFPSLSCIVVCPRAKGGTDPPSVEMAQTLGARVHFIPANRLPINYAQARRYIESRSGVMLPFGMECREAVEAVALEASLLPSKIVSNSTVILCCGSGVTLAGLLKGLPASPRRIIGVSSGRAVSQINRCVRRHAAGLAYNVELIPSFMPYQDPANLACPFPCHPHYDLKAWKYLTQHLDEYEDPILFWNVAG